MTTPCPHCWTPEAQQFAAENATIAALQVENARLTRELAEHDAWYKNELDSLRGRWNQSLAVAAGYHSELIQEYHGNVALGAILGAHEDETMQECALRVMRENATLRARVISQHALIKSQRRIRTVLIAALRRQAARLRALGD